MPSHIFLHAQHARGLNLDRKLAFPMAGDAARAREAFDNMHDPDKVHKKIALKSFMKKDAVFLMEGADPGSSPG